MPSDQLSYVLTGNSRGWVDSKAWPCILLTLLPANLAFWTFRHHRANVYHLWRNAPPSPPWGKSTHRHKHLSRGVILLLSTYLPLKPAPIENYIMLVMSPDGPPRHQTKPVRLVAGDLRGGN